MDEGVNFALFSENATAVELCLFECADGSGAIRRINMPVRTDLVWHAFVPELSPGQLYGYRVHGPYAPARGHRFNPHKLLIDPYARALAGPLRWSDAVYGYTRGSREADLSFDKRNSDTFVPKGIVIDNAFDWGDDRPPRTPWSQTVIYECHVKGLTALHPDVPPNERGTYAAVGSEPIIEHLRSLGVTAVELLPVQHTLHERGLLQRGLLNYWGYNPIAFSAPDARFAVDPSGYQVHEFKAMVKRLHQAGIEVILDVVYNHTGEGNRLGPTISLRGIDNASYYLVNRQERRLYDDYTGCGNSLNMRHPRTLQLVMDSLRYWVEEMHVDGFRFDLATVHGRGQGAMDPASPFFAAVAQDPVLASIKLIAEPWDTGDDGYQLGAFPVGWSEWNEKFQSTMRAFWRSDRVAVGELTSRLAGSSDVFGRNRRGTRASINYITAHDGFTLQDLVSYEHKHNEANGEANRDGNELNRSCNWGAEGPTNDPEVTARRDRVKRSMLASLAFSLGVPMITAGDELGRTQAGNNNAYCQDNETSWIDWQIGESQQALLAFTRKLMALRREYEVFTRSEHFSGQADHRTGIKDVTWLSDDGTEMSANDFPNANRRSLCALLHWHSRRSRAGDESDRSTSVESASTLLMILNGTSHCKIVNLPAMGVEGEWVRVVDTTQEHMQSGPINNDAVEVAAHSLALLKYESH